MARQGDWLNAMTTAPHSISIFAPTATAKRSAYSLVELMIGMAMMVGLMAMAAPAINGIQNGCNMSAAAYEIAGVLENARTYAVANRTYVWVGFFEESAETPGAAGTGRVILSVVASRDGTKIYNDSDPRKTIPGDRLLQLGKLVKLENAHLALLDNGTGRDDFFAGRPAVDGTCGRYGEINSSLGSPFTNSKFPFTYPLTKGRYTFPKTLLFTPRGEAKVNGTYTIRPEIEIGLQPARGTTAEKDSRNIAAVQLSGILGRVKIYQP